MRKEDWLRGLVKPTEQNEKSRTGGDESNAKDREAEARMVLRSRDDVKIREAEQGLCKRQR